MKQHPVMRTLMLTLICLPALCAAGPLRSYDNELGETIALVRAGALTQAIEHIEKNNDGADKDLLYFLEKGELLSLSGDYPHSRETWRQGDRIIQGWEDDFRVNPDKLFGDIGSYLIGDKTRRYDGQDYEKVMLSTRLTLNHLLLGDFEHARIEMKKTYEREKLIESFREKEYEALRAENEKQGNGEVKTLDAYPMAELDTSEVRALKNGFQNAFAHYLAGYFFEVTGEPSLAEPGYRNALQLAPGKAIIARALQNVGKTRSASGESDVLFVIESGFAPRIDSLNIPIPIPRKNGTVITPLSFPLIKSAGPVPVPPWVQIAGRRLPVDTLTNIDTMARRLLKDQLPGILLRTILRAGFKSLVQDQAQKAHWLAGLVANVLSVATEQADDRSWRSLPERISVARITLPHGNYEIALPGGSGTYRTTVEISGRFSIVPIRLTGSAVHVGRAPLLSIPAAGDSAPADAEVAPSGSETGTDAETLPPHTVRQEEQDNTPAGQDTPRSLPQEKASVAPQQDGVASEKRLHVGDTTYIGDFRFAQPSGLANGHGRVEWSNGDTFEGALENGLRVGHGVFTAKSAGFRYTGDWRDDRQNGSGRTAFDNGDVYEGEMKDGLFHGQGRYITPEGPRYEGQWQNGVKEGPGKLTFPDGDCWEGIFSADRPTEQGAMSFTRPPHPGVGVVPDNATPAHER